VVEEEALDRRRIEPVNTDPAGPCDVIMEPIPDERDVDENRAFRQSTIVTQILDILPDQVVAGWGGER